MARVAVTWGLTNATFSRSCSCAIRARPSPRHPLLLSLSSRALGMAVSGWHSSAGSAADWPHSTAGLNSATCSILRHTTTRDECRILTSDGPRSVCACVRVCCRDKCHFCPSCHSRFAVLAVPLIGVNRLRVWQYEQCASLRDSVKSLGALSSDVSVAARESIAATYRSKAVRVQWRHSNATACSMPYQPKLRLISPLAVCVFVLCCAAVLCRQADCPLSTAHPPNGFEWSASHSDIVGSQVSRGAGVSVVSSNCCLMGGAFAVLLPRPSAVVLLGVLAVCCAPTATCGHRNKRPRREKRSGSGTEANSGVRQVHCSADIAHHRSMHCDG